MKLSSSARSVMVGAALAGLAGVGVGTTVAAHSAAPAGGTQTSAMGQAAPPVDGVASPLTPSPTSHSTPSPTSHPTPSKQVRRAATVRSTSVSMADATRIAARVAGGRVTDSEEDWGATGRTYELKVERADGITRKVVVDSRNGHVLANRVTDRPDRPDEDRWEHDGPDTDDDD